MEHEAEMGRIVAARVAAGADSESIVRELSQNFEYVRTALRAYVNGFVEAHHDADELEGAEQAQLRSFRLAR
jgi:hypothetical protein